MLHRQFRSSRRCHSAPSHSIYQARSWQGKPCARHRSGGNHAKLAGIFSGSLIDDDAVLVKQGGVCCRSLAIIILHPAPTSVDERVTKKDFSDVKNEALQPYGPKPNSEGKSLKEFCKSYVYDVLVTNQMQTKAAFSHAMAVMDKEGRLGDGRRRASQWLWLNFSRMLRGSVPKP